MERIRCDRTATWRGLQNLFANGGQTLDLRRAFADDEGRFEARFVDDGKANLGRSSEFLLLEALRRRDEGRA